MKLKIKGKEKKKRFCLRANVLVKLNEKVEKENILNFGLYIKFCLQRGAVFQIIMTDKRKSLPT